MEAVYNLESVNELAGGDKEFVTILISTFLEEIPPDVESMLAAVQSNNAAEAYQYAHKMKPNLQLFNIDVLPEIKIIESWTKENKDKSAIEPAIEKIVVVVGEVIAALQKDFG